MPFNLPTVAHAVLESSYSETSCIGEPTRTVTYRTLGRDRCFQSIAPPVILCPYIKSRADALANLPNPARWHPEREMWPRTATNGSSSQVIASALLGNNRRRVFIMSEDNSSPDEPNGLSRKVEITRLKPTKSHEEIRENLRAALIRFGFKIVRTSKHALATPP